MSIGIIPYMMVLFSLLSLFTGYAISAFFFVRPIKKELKELKDGQAEIKNKLSKK